MANKVTVISALTFLVTHIGIAPTALAHEAELVEQRCLSILETGNRSALRCSRSWKHYLTNIPIITVSH